MCMSGCWICTFFCFMSLSRKNVEQIKQNNMASMPLKKLIWRLGLPMIISMAIAMVFHYLKNKEIDGSLKYIKPKMGIIKGFKMVQMDLSYLK